GNIYDIHSVGLSEESATSNFVAREILMQKYGITPHFKHRDEGETCDARIIIGDQALKVAAAKDEDETHIDIGQAWYEMTGLPIVYAVCVARIPELIEDFTEIFSEIKERNLDLLPSLLEQKGLEMYYEYIRGLDYDLTQDHKKALSLLESWAKMENEIAL
ncbi:MqnA/MqnD/SBP family protein, partial [Candidatus Omnitrophota bacterium]